MCPDEEAESSQKGGIFAETKKTKEKWQEQKYYVFVRRYSPICLRALLRLLVAHFRKLCRSVALRFVPLCLVLAASTSVATSSTR